MFTLNHFSDVVAVAKTFGVSALEYAMKNGTISIGACQTIRDCKRWAASEVIEIENVNDGNIEYSVDINFKSEFCGDNYITMLQDMSVVRTGFGAYNVDIKTAMEKGYITPAILANAIEEINKRNAASTVLYP